MTRREFLGEECYLAWLQDYEELRAFRNKVSGRRPTDEERIVLAVNKPWEQFYKGVLR